MHIAESLERFGVTDPDGYEIHSFAWGGHPSQKVEEVHTATKLWFKYLKEEIAKDKEKGMIKNSEAAVHRAVLETAEQYGLLPTSLGW